MSATTTHDHPTRSTAANVLVVSVAAFLASLDLFIVNIAFPEIRSAFGATDLGALSWVLNAYTVVFAAFLNPAGRLGDRYGHRRIFLSGLTVFLLGSLACGLSPSLALLIAARVVQAVGAAMLMPSSLALLMAAVPAERRTVAVSTWAAVGAMAAALGPPIGGLLVEFDWRWIFFVNLPLGVLALAVAPGVLPKVTTGGSGVPDLFGALSLVVGVAALVWAIVEIPAADATVAKIFAAAALAVGALGLAIWRSTRHHTPAIDLAAIRVHPMWSSSVALLLFAAAFGAMLLGNVMLLTTIWHETPALAGLCLSPGPVVVVLVSLTLASRLISKHGTGAIAALGAAIYAAGIVFWLFRVDVEPHYLADFLPGQILTGAGVGLVIPSLSGVTGKALPANQWGSGSALTNTARQLGTVLGTAILTMVYQSGISMSSVRFGWDLIAASAAAAALIAVALAFGWKTTLEGGQLS
ncbi:MFS transporter [Mycolicibacterium sphagni]|uniref:MFS transporter n=1 Tax=Mycolicibacterium sphagni TaxID=1786 RepID=UPI001F353323|nr:MFS transporter [Mycolicibacterium sphagni]